MNTRSVDMRDNEMTSHFENLNSNIANLEFELYKTKKNAQLLAQGWQEAVSSLNTMVDKEGHRLEAERVNLMIYSATLELVYQLRSEVRELKAQRDTAKEAEARAVEALRKVAAIIDQLGPDRPSAQYMAESAHRVASEVMNFIFKQEGRSR
jgi:hypothetical protein